MAGATGLPQGLIFLGLVTGVSAADSSLVGMAVAGAISFVFLVAVIFFIGISFAWGDWFNSWMQNKGKVRMPKAYWKKKEEAKRRLLLAAESHSRTPSMVNGNPPAQAVDRESKKRVETQNNIQTYVPSHIQGEYLAQTQTYIVEAGPNAQSSWVQGWNQNSNQFGNKAYEEKDVTMELGEEVDDEFRIETELTDNEVLDVGPFKTVHTNERPIEGDVYNEPYIYTTVDSTNRSSITQGAVVTGTTVSTVVTTTTNEVTSTEMQEAASGGSNRGEVVTNFEDMLVHL